MTERSRKQIKELRLTGSGVDQITSILRWKHKGGDEAHCLVRLFFWLTQPKALAVISEIESNPLGLELADDFPGVVDAVIRRFRTDIGSHTKHIVWVAHHGRFSFFEVLDQETFTIVDLKWKGESADCDLSDWRLLQASELLTILDGVELEPVQDVLRDLGWS